ncbi:MAG: response regulator, partial [Gammaproteobacteria bacterium]
TTLSYKGRVGDSPERGAPAVGQGTTDNAAAVKRVTGRKVLVAEDSLVNQAYIKETLSRLGFGVSLAGNGEEAARMCRDRQFDAVIMDCHMPIMDGYEATKEICRMIEVGTIPYVPVLALTADVAESNRQRCESAGFCEFLTKPVKEATLEAALERWFERRDGRNGVSADPASAASPVVVPADEAVRQGRFAGAKVLVVEDSEVNQAYLQETLAQLGCAASIAANGKEAIALAEAGAFDLILMDCHMPVMNGYEATTALVRMMDAGTVPKAPIVALTADVVQDNKEQCRSVGMVDCVGKPVRKDTLAEVLERWLTGGAAIAADIGAADLDVPDTGDYVDTEVLREGQDLFQEDFWPLVDRFIVDVNNNLDSIRSSLSQFDLAAIHRPVHSIKSSSRQIGAMALGNVAEDVEQQVKPGADIDPRGIGPAIDELQRVVDATCDALRDMRPR